MPFTELFSYQQKMKPYYHVPILLLYFNLSCLNNNPLPSYPILCTLSYFIVFIIKCDNIKECWRSVKIVVMFIEAFRPEFLVCER